MKRNQLQQAIDELEADKLVIQHAIDKLKATAAAKPKAVNKKATPKGLSS